MKRELLDLVWEHDELAELDAPARRLALRSLLGPHVDERDLGAEIAALADEIDGYGPLSSVMADDSVTDVLVNGASEVWVDRDGELERAACAFSGAADLVAFIERLVGSAGGRVDASRPVGDVRLPDGARMHVVLPPLAPDGPLVSIRRFPARPFTLEDLTSRGMLSEAQASDLAELVAGRRSIAIGGATGTGKTTLVNALLAQVPPCERIVTIEETPELRPSHPHCVALVARPPNLEGNGEVSLDILVRAALRMRPDRIVVGEVRGPEVGAALTAMSTGHPGSLVTVHARSAEEVLDRLTDLAIAHCGLPEGRLAALVRAAVDVVVYLERVGGTRKATAISVYR